MKDAMDLIDDAIDDLVDGYRRRHPKLGDLGLFTLIRANPKVRLPDLEITQALNRTADK